MTVETILESKVKSRLSDYLGIEINNLLNIGSATVFGGAIVSALINSDINDIDLLIMPYEGDKTSSFLKKHGYTDIYFSYKDRFEYQHFKIQPPVTFENKEGSKIQLIKRDDFNYEESSLKEVCTVTDWNGVESKKLKFVKDVISEFISQVDISICGMGLNREQGLFESIPSIYFQIANREFSTYPNNKMYSTKQIGGRIQKYINKGFIIK
jgi:hypothetical protein